MTSPSTVIAAVLCLQMGCSRTTVEAAFELRHEALSRWIAGRIPLSVAFLAPDLFLGNVQKTANMRKITGSEVANDLRKVANLQKTARTTKHYGRTVHVEVYGKMN